MNETVLSKICLAKHQYDDAVINIKRENDFLNCIGIIVLQDAVESLLLALCDHINIDIADKDAFHKYIEKINKKIDPKKLPYRTHLNDLNKMRVSAKHSAIIPNKTAINNLIPAISSFLSDVALDHLGVDFWIMNEGRNLTNQTIKNFIDEAYSSYEEENYFNTLVACRKAIHIEIERAYDISQFRTITKHMKLMSSFSFAPSYAKTPDYIKEHVKAPTDYICLDTNHVDNEMTKSGVDHITFWNVLRMTPPVYLNHNEEWIVKNIYSLKYDENIKKNSEYILQSTVAILMAKQRYNEKLKSSYHQFHHKIIPKGTHIYERAESINVSPKKIVEEDFRGNQHCKTIGLDGEEYIELLTYHPFEFGFILAKDLE
ncbi:hypothetical protein [Maridesulfovibrio ferrireducens]|uniref:hypothetical protein n=1 Tax=Maridesulfovibrio ferrireducens TaxID=246191 RepID=UPI001A25C40B|nr:hypothetical protein [Maridesulfovibrio ferrireducens]MBI9110272.1 hypothetical protein [Maridesulfovibrio ferrireducens]